MTSRMPMSNSTPATTVQNSTVARKSDHVIVDCDNLSLGLNSCHWE